METGTLSPAQRETLEAIAERLIPSDELGPGAGSSGAPAYIERALGGPYADLLGAYRAGLDALGAAAFATLAPERQDELLAGLETSELPAERAFFELVRAHVLEGMFGDPAWGGNRDGAGWRLIDYPGPRRAWSEHEQQLDVRP